MKNLVNCRLCSYIILTIVILCVPVAWAQSVKTIDGFAEIPLDIYKSKTPNSPTVVYAHGCSGYDNFDFQIPKRKWTYSFDEETFPINKIKKIGIGVNNFSGQTTVLVLDVSSGKIITTKLN